MGRRQRIKARRAIGAVVTQVGADMVEMLDGQPGRAERTRAARERNTGHQAAPVRDTASPSGDWFKIRNFVDQPNRAAIYIYEEIGYWGTSANEFVQMLNQLNVDYLDVHINSPGGEVDDGVAIFNAIRQHKAYVTVYIDSLAASAASFIAMAGDKVCISEFGQLMIHDAMGLAFGNEAEVNEFANLLGRYSNNVAAIYARQAGGTPEQWRDVMRAETWYTGAEAVEAGLCDEVHDLLAADEDVAPDHEDEPMAARMTARWDMSLFSFRYQGREAAPAPALANHVEPEPEVVPEVAAAPEPVVPVDAAEPEPVAVAEPAEDVVADVAPSVVPEATTEPPISAAQEPEVEVVGEPAAEVEPEPAAEPVAEVPAVVPDTAPAEAAPEPVAATTDTDPWAQSMSSLLSATPASPTWDDVLSTLTKP